MIDQDRTDLMALQKLDIKIQETKQHIGAFDPLFEEVEEPALILETELGTARTRLQEMKLEERRLELSSEEKETRRKRLDEKLGAVRNLREEAAVSAELEMVKRALQTDEQEALTLLDQLRKMEERGVELEAAYAEATEIVEPKRQELLDQRSEAEEALASLYKERQQFVEKMNSDELTVYDAIRAGGRKVAVAGLTEDGACGHCFSVIPLQLQNQIRHGTELIRCEGCGVILAAVESEVEAGSSHEESGGAVSGVQIPATGEEGDPTDQELVESTGGEDAEVESEESDSDEMSNPLDIGTDKDQDQE